MEVKNKVLDVQIFAATRFFLSIRWYIAELGIFVESIRSIYLFYFLLFFKWL